MQLNLSLPNGTNAEVYPHIGGIINKLTFVQGNKHIQVMDGYANEEELEALSYSRGIKMTPYPNRIKDGKYSFLGKDYQMEINKPKENNSIHGLLQKAVYEVVEHSTHDDHAVLHIAHTYDGSVPGFPFPFRYEMVYRLENESLTCTTMATNLGTETMPFGDGWHPYFGFDCPADHLYLELPSSTYLIADERLIPTGETREMGAFQKMQKVEDANFDTGFILNSEEGIVTTKIYAPLWGGATLELWQETGHNKYNFLQVFIPPFRRSIALEPMTCVADAFNNGIGLISLAPGEQFKGSYGVKLLVLP